ncbi:RNA polymerase sigma factor [Homoserinibacter sp. YIM 151385]|uniref:RNA polymerase sigma factor n=1 Tax=Homoserinibacter sp. YIM 151385 TaxID=2985506 RepID=UPI0022F0E42B|nr:sigma-70 family RNA polymerase sigma factor [Homoserinibacter sp. YIM 151385]WBU38266.1 sigma-70 family RNA polymerase sigma factor [Homoserinibacter sp. YIM 151385]
MADRRAAWEQTVVDLVDRRGEALSRYALLLCGNRDDAADLVQDALVKTFGRLRNGFDVERAEAYVRRAIMTTWLDRGRRATRWRRIAPLASEPELQPSRAEDVERRLDLHDELRRLSPRERACLVLRYYDDLKVDDVAAALGISSGAVKRYLSDGLAKMAISLADDGTPADRTGAPGARLAQDASAERAARTTGRGGRHGR